MNVRGELRGVAVSAIVCAGALAVVALIIAAAGYDVFESAAAAWRAAFGSSMAIFSGTLKRATPLLLMGISVALSFRAGMLNIGGEGQLLAGATASVAVALQAPAGTPGPVLVPLELSCGIIAGALWGAIPAWLRVRFQVTEVVSTLLLNFVAANLVGFLIRGPMQEPTGAYPQSASIPAAARLPLLIDGQQLHLGFLFAVGTAMVAWFVFRKTAAGFRLALVGASPRAAESAGRVNVAAVQVRALVMSGAIAGFAGACVVSGDTQILYEGLSPGYGYTAIAVALLGGLNPLGILASASLFGALAAGAEGVQRDAGVPAEFAAVVAAVVVLGLLSAPFIRRWLLAPRRTAPG